MKRPWEHWGRQQDDMELLQTDVMRFMAILGLCLAAIFSLVRSPDFPDTANALPDPLSQQTERDPVPIERRAQEGSHSTTSVKTISENTVSDKETGFTLEFLSAVDLERLVTDGGGSLYISDGNGFWRWMGGGYARVGEPQRYYRMHTATVPPGFRQQLPMGRAADDWDWGVVLPVRTEESIDSLVQQHQGGELLISADGGVTLRAGS